MEPIWPSILYRHPTGVAREWMVHMDLMADLKTSKNKPLKTITTENSCAATSLFFHILCHRPD